MDVMDQRRPQNSRPGKNTSTAQHHTDARLRSLWTQLLSQTRSMAQSQPSSSFSASALEGGVRVSQSRRTARSRSREPYAVSPLRQRRSSTQRCAADPSTSSRSADGPLSTCAVYRSLLRQSASFVVLPGQGAVAMAGLSRKTSSARLSDAEWHVAWRTEGGVLCSCQESAAELAKSSMQHPDSSVRASCLHARQLAVLDQADSMDASEGPVVFQFKEEPYLAAVKADARWAVVGLRGQHLRCLSCLKPHCDHTGTFRKCMEEAKLEWRPRQPLSPEEDHLPPSPQRHVPFPLPPSSVQFPRLEPGRGAVAVDGGGVTHHVSVESPAFGGPGFVRLSQNFAIHHSLFRRYLGLLHSDGLPLASLHRSLRSEQSLASEPRPILSLSQFQRGWRQFLHGLALPDSVPCEECGPQPETLILDGTSLACRRSALPPRPEAHDDREPVQGLRYDQRVFIPSAQERRLVRKLAEGQTVEHLNVEGRLGELLRRACGGRSGPFAAAQHFRPLLMELSATTAIPALLPFHMDPVRRCLRRVWANELRPWERGQEDNWSLLAKAAPALLRCLSDVHRGEGRIPVAVAALLESRGQTFRQALQASPEPAPLQPLPDAPMPQSHFPFWTKVRPSRRYLSDGRSQPAGQQCSKNFPSHGVLLPGILTCLCSHGKIYGATLMERAESPRHVFETLLLHLPRAPRNVVYDFACQLQQYCLAREPKYFMETRFLVDRFHQKNHTACGGGQRLSEFAAAPELAELNSQAAEQLNSRLRLLRRSLSYTNYHDFKATLRLFIFLINRNLS